MGAKPCPMRPLCLGMLAVSCNPARREQMRQAIEDCRAAECFALFGGHDAT